MEFSTKGSEHDPLSARVDRQTKEYHKQDPSTLELVTEFWKICLPACIAQFCLNADFLCLVIASQFNDTEKVAGLGLAISIIVVLGELIEGISLPIETLTAHAHGHGDLRLCGLYLNRTILVVFGTYLAILIWAFFFLYLKPILLNFG